MGLIWIQVTTSPVELWSAKGSIARSDKEFFDRNFNPFYRIEQLIIRPHDQSPFQGHGGSWGPVFRLEFLKTVLQFQNSIANLTAEYNGTVVTLKSICFRPLYPDNDECAIQSALQYFQNDPANIDTEKYLDHFKACIK